MVEVFPRLYCGNENDYLNLEKEHVPGREIDQPTNGWAVIHTCKDPYHKQMVGYATRGCPKDSPNYYFIEADNRLALNIVDAPEARFFDKSMIDKALDFIEQKLGEGLKALVHCNGGFSRSPSICLLYIFSRAYKLRGVSLEDCETEFMKKYPGYMPGSGIRGFMKEHWLEYCPAE